MDKSADKKPRVLDLGEEDITAKPQPRVLDLGEEEITAKPDHTGSMYGKLDSLTKTKRAVPDAPSVTGHDAIVKLYNDYKNDVIRDQDPTDEQLAVLHGIATKLLEK